MVRIGSIELQATNLREELDPGDPDLGVPANAGDWSVRAGTLSSYLLDPFKPDVDPVNYASVWLSYNDYEDGRIEIISITIKNQTDQNVYFLRVNIEARGKDNLPPMAPSSIFSIYPDSTGSNSDYLATIRPGETNTTYFYDGQSPSPKVTYLTYSDPVIVTVIAHYKYYNVVIDRTWYSAISYTIP
jgi:hypothetical protein